VVNLYYPKASNRGQIWFIPLRQIMYNVIRRNCDAQHNKSIFCRKKCMFPKWNVGAISLSSVGVLQVQVK